MLVMNLFLNVYHVGIYQYDTIKPLESYLQNYF